MVKHSERLFFDTDADDNEYIVLDDGIYCYENGTALRLSFDGKNWEKLDLDLNPDADADVNVLPSARLPLGDQSLVYDGRAVVCKSIDSSPNDGVYFMELAGKTTITADWILKEEETDQSIAESLLDGGTSYMSDGYVIGNVYVYVERGTDEDNELVQQINGYSLETGEHFNITTVEDRNLELLYVPGESRIYYRTSSVGTVQLPDYEYKCVEVYGGTIYDLDF